MTAPAMARKPVHRPTKAQLLQRYERPDGRERLRELERQMSQSSASAANRIAWFEEKLREAQADIEWIRSHKEMADSVLRDIAEITGEIAA